VQIAELQGRLHRYGVGLASSTIRKLAHEGVITPPLRYHKSEGKGRGGPSNWPDDSVGEIVAFWVLTHDPMRGATRKSTIRFIRSTWDLLHADDVAKRLGLSVQADGVDGSDPLMGFSQCYLKSGSSLCYWCHSVVAKWIATVQKVQDGLPIDQPVLLTYVWVLYKDQDGDIVALFDRVERGEPRKGAEDSVAIEFSMHKTRRPTENGLNGGHPS
jgi:hypothetical protein